MSDLVIVHLYPRLLRTYGDRGNVLALKRRAEWRGFRVRVDEVSIGERLPRDAGLILLGGGTDRVQEIVGKDLAARRDELAGAAQSGAVVLGICGGYQFLGMRYVMPDGREIEGLSLLDVETRASERRIIGRVRARGAPWGEAFDLVGFENHGGRTTLGPSVQPLASVSRRHGNNGRDGTEGAVRDSVVGTYLHGPVLAVNPGFTDALLARALSPRNGNEPLVPLQDDEERLAHADAARRIREEHRAKKRSMLVAASLIALSLAFGGPRAAREIDDDDGHRGDRVAPAAAVERPLMVPYELVRTAEITGTLRS